MGSVTANIFKLFKGGGAQAGGVESGRKAPPRSQRHSSGFKEFMRAIKGQEELSFLDLGPTSASNINLLTARGFKVFTEDLLTSASDPDLLTTNEEGAKVIDINRFLKENVIYRGPILDAVLFWDIADYLPEPLVKPVIERICTMMKPGGILLAFFHTKDAGPEAPYSRYHIAGDDALDLQPTQVRQADGKPGYVKLQRVFNNRHIENLFKDYSSLKFFLARDNIREVLVVR